MSCPHTISVQTIASPALSISSLKTTLSTGGDTVVTMAVQESSPLHATVLVAGPVTLSVQAGADLAASVLLRLTALESQALGATVPDRVFYSDDFAHIYVGRVNAADQTEANPIWQIYRYTIADETVAYADGDELYNNIWSDRTMLTYI